MNIFNKQYINGLSYTSFIGLINQWNVPPGAFDTLNRWRQNSNLNKRSFLVEFACTTGFSSRELSLMTCCKAMGIDISAKSIQSAKENKKRYAPEALLTYEVADGIKYKLSIPPTHILWGASLRFFDDPDIVVTHAVKLFQKQEGYILSNEFYTPKGIPDNLIREALSIFDINVTQIGYKKVMEPYKGLDLMYEEKKQPIQETSKELAHYCESTIKRFMKNNTLNSDEVYQAIYERLYKIKDMSNKLRPYQKYNVLVFRYRASTYPNRYVEYF